MRTYTREETISIGKQRYKIAKITAFVICGITFAIGGAVLYYWIMNQPNDSVLAIWISFIAGAIIATIFTILYKPDYLQIGVNYYHNIINREVIRKSAKNNIDEKYRPKFKPESLYSRLTQEESTTYYDAEDCINVDLRKEYPLFYKSYQPKRNITVSRSSSTTEQDPFDELEEFYSGKKEFDELSEDAKNIYYDDEFYDE